MTRAALAVLVLLAGCGPAPSAGGRATEAREPASVSEMLKEEARLNEACRGGSGDDPTTRQACAARDALVAKLQAAGMCYGPVEAPMYQQKWGPCAAQAAVAARGVQVASEQAPSEPVDQIAFDRVSAIRDGKVQRYMAAADHCMHAKAEAMLYAGETSRAGLEQASYANCSTTLVAILQSEAALSAEDARTGAEAMSRRAVDDVLAAYGN